MIRVLVADDSITARTLLVAILSSDPEIHVVGEAVDGVQAVELTRKLRPDVITMDVRMPRMDGFEATKEIMISSPTPIIIVTSSVVFKNVETSMYALRAGALAVLAKPVGPHAAGFDEAAQQLIGHVKALSQVKVVRHWRQRPSQEKNLAGTVWNERPRVVALACSTGGPAALHQLLTSLPGDFPVPMLIVQHITEGFAGGLAEWLNKASDLRVKIAEDGEPLAPHTVFLAPDNQHLGVSTRLNIHLDEAPPVNGFRPSGTHLFKSVAQVFGPSAVGMILTGMGDDGVEGLRVLHQAGGRIIAQDETSSVIFGMPGVAIAAGLVDMVLPLEAMASRLVELAAGSVPGYRTK